MLYLLPQAIDRAADRAPDKDALRFSGRSMSYGELAERSNRLAHVLIDQGVRRGDRVGLYTYKGLDAAVAMYGILKAGAAYVPLDPTAPVSRLSFIVRDCGIRHLVTEENRAGMLDQMTRLGSGLECLIGVANAGDRTIRTISRGEVDQAPTDRPEAGTTELDLAYILYTSGSTGVPKGVMHTHRSALSFAGIAAETYGFRPEDRLSNHAPLHFDLSTLDFFSAAIVGATTVIFPEMVTQLPASLSKLMQDERLTVYYTVPFALTHLLQYGAIEKRDLSALRWVLFGGEPFPTKHLRRLMSLLPNAQFSNVYGPTETNGCTYYIVPPLPDDMDEPIPIGHLYGNVEALVVDENDREVEPGRAGELLIRSPTMMRGYWARPDLNEKVFFRRSRFDVYDDVFHRTGDLVRTRPDGQYVFLGRKDRQMKVRGYRVELDEIESNLLSHPEVEAAAVFPVPDDNGNHRLEAAVMTRPDTRLQEMDFARYASSLLPPYAVPEKITVVHQLPTTSTGKIDRLQLQSIALARNGNV